MNETGNDSQSTVYALTSAERTDRGRVRENNEDIGLSLPGSGLFAVADGMGGAREGEVAAQAVVDHLKEACADPSLALPARIRLCREAANAASLWIRQYAARQGNPGMGTTLCVLLFDPLDPAAAACLHAGDSRLYRLRNGILEQLTRDHSMATLAGVAHEGQVPSPFRSMITRAVGVRRNVDLETTFLDVARGDLFLLCTDGLHNMVPRDEMARLLERGSDLDAKAVALVEAALAAGGEDNVTLILVRAGGGAEPDGTDGADSLPGRMLPPPARETRSQSENGRRVVSLLMLALVGFIAVWYAFSKWPENKDPLPPAPVAPETPVPEQVTLPSPESEPTVPPVADVPENELKETAQAKAWQREREDVAADPERLKARHQAVSRAFTRLGEWTGKPLSAPSLMFAGRLEDRPAAWAQYLAAAQAQWRGLCEQEVARMRAESSCVTPDGLRSLWQVAQGKGPDDPEFRDLLAAWEEWSRELDQMDRFLRDYADVREPFLYAVKSDLFTPGREAADLGDRAWDLTLPHINSVWKKRDSMLGTKNPADPAWVDETIRQANAIWEGYARAGHSIRPWRQSVEPAAIKAFFDRLAAGEPVRDAASP